jgi:hypothetical protein
LNLGVSGLVDLSREELIAYGLEQQARVAELLALNGLQASALERVTAAHEELTAAHEQLRTAYDELAVKVARLEHLLSRNSGDSSMPPSLDDKPGGAPPKGKGRATSKRAKGKQKGAPGANLSWSDAPADRQDQFPQGACGCGADLAGAADLGVVDAGALNARCGSASVGSTAQSATPWSGVHSAFNAASSSHWQGRPRGLPCHLLTTTKRA